MLVLAISIPVRSFAKLSSSWLVQYSRSDLALNQVITDPQTPPPYLGK